MPRYIDVDDALQAHLEYLNEHIRDHDKAIYAKGWNACNSAYYDAIKKIDSISPDEVRGVGQPVKIFNDPWTGKMFTTCSRCDGKISPKDCYCKHCGARMKGAEDETTD